MTAGNNYNYSNSVGLSSTNILLRNMTKRNRASPLEILGAVQTSVLGLCRA